LHFNEFVIKIPIDELELHKHLLSRGVHGGYLMNTWSKNSFPELGNAMLFNVTEVHTDSDIKKLVDALREVS
jgi:glycine dehydrogenase subunit 1